MGLKIFRSPLLSAIPWVHHAFFSRQGGTSKGPFTSLNFSTRRGDLLENVQKNRALAAQAFGLEETFLCLLHQTHSAKVIPLNEPISGSLPPEGDASLTQTPNLILGIQTADCVPILLAAKNKPIVAAIHAGWQGLVHGIMENTLIQMQQEGAILEQIVAAIGPCIHQKSYEVGQDLYDLFYCRSPLFKQHFEPSSKPQHFFLNLPGCARDILLSQGILLDSIDNINLDTYTSPELFFSCRRAAHNQKQQFGGQLSAIMVKSQ